MLAVCEFATAGEEGGLGDTAGGAERPDGLAGGLPGGNRVPPELLAVRTAATGLRHRQGLLVGEKASILHEPARRPLTGRLPSRACPSRRPSASPPRRPPRPAAAPAGSPRRTCRSGRASWAPPGTGRTPP